MDKKKEKSVRLPMSPAKKIMLGVVLIAAAIALIYLVYYLIRFKAYNGNRKYMTTYEYEQGTELEFLKEAKSDVPGFKLVAENETLKLYTDTATCNVAIFDKRNGSVSYTNPLNADADTVAKAANKNLLKSQFVLSFYNTAVASANYDSYSKSVMSHNYKWEGIKNGIRYVYSVGEPQNIGKDGMTYFVVPLEYRLDGDSLVVNIPAKGIEEHGPGYIYKIQLLRYMGASSYDDKGYMVVPNGSGAVINFNNGKKSAAAYSQYIYGIDPMVANYTTLEESDDARLPIFALCYDDRSVAGTVETGATVANIAANVSGAYNDYNFVYPSFVIRNIDNLMMFGNAKTDTFVMEENLYDINMQVRYSFLTEEYKGYSGLANYYREKLIKDGVLSRLDRSGSIPFYYDVIAGVKETGHILGVGYLHVFSMTDFDEAEEIARTLAENGVTNQVMNLQGWFNNGYYHDSADKINVNLKLGGRSGLKSLKETLNGLGGKLYGDVCFQKVSFVAKRYNYNAESSRYYGGGYVAAFGQNDPTTLRNTASLGYMETRYNLISPRFLPRYVNKFASKVTKVALDGLSLRDLGNTLQSDKKRTNVIDRDQALNVVLGQLETLKDTGKKLLLDSANAYAFGYTEDIINVPTDGNEFFICDGSIPLYQMIIHGCIDYSSKLLNYEDSNRERERLLELIETGTAPHYQFTKEEASRMKNTGLNRFYATTFDNYMQEALDAYDYVNGALKQVEGAMMIGHRSEGSLRAVNYDNGVTIYINYGEDDTVMDGIVIPAKDYRTEGDR
jgi:hypothetical protein